MLICRTFDRAEPRTVRGRLERNLAVKRIQGEVESAARNLLECLERDAPLELATEEREALDVALANLSVAGLPETWDEY